MTFGPILSSTHMIVTKQDREDHNLSGRKPKAVFGQTAPKVKTPALSRKTAYEEEEVCGACLSGCAPCAIQELIGVEMISVITGVDLLGTAGGGRGSRSRHRAAITMEIRIGRHSSVGTPSRFAPMRPT